MLGRLDDQWFCTEATGRRKPVPGIRTDVSLATGDTRELWFRFRIDDGSQAGGPAASMRALSDRLPRANADQAGAEVPWLAARLRNAGPGPRANSPLGARVRLPVPDEGSMLSARGEGTGGGGIWSAVCMTLIRAADRNDQEMARDELRWMSLDSHAKAYRGIWEGTLSNLHSHSQPLLSYLWLADAARQPADRLARRMAQQAGCAGDRSRRGRRLAPTRPLVARTATQ
jgi:hypothetical protein